jgi:hypothetical protein
VGGSDELVRGRAARRRLAWADAYAALSKAEESTSLTGRIWRIWRAPPISSAGTPGKWLVPR